MTTTPPPTPPDISASPATDPPPDLPPDLPTDLPTEQPTEQPTGTATDGPSDGPSDSSPDSPADSLTGGDRSDLRNWWDSLYRIDANRILGGVCGGLGHRFGLPRWLVILGLVLITMLGPGVPLYLGLWLLLPDEYGRRILQDSRWRDLAIAALGVVVAFTALGLGGNLFFLKELGTVAPWAVILVGIGLLTRRPGAPTASPPQSTSAHLSEAQAVSTTMASTATAAATPPKATTLRGSGEPRKRRTYRTPVVGPFTWCVALIAAALLGLVALGDPRSIGPGVIVAAVTIVFGAGLVFSAFRGRARGLVLPALAGICLLLGLGVIDLRADTFLSAVDVRYVTQEELPRRVKSGWGRTRVDLSTLELQSDTLIDIEAPAGITTVVLPAAANSEVHVDIGAGDARRYGALPMNDDLRRWATSSPLPSTGDPIDTDRASRLSDQYAVAEVAIATRDSTMSVDTGSDHTLVVNISLGAGEVRVIEPVWASVPTSVMTPQRACLAAVGADAEIGATAEGGATSEAVTDDEMVAVPCTSVEDPASLVPACYDRFTGWLADCAGPRDQWTDVVPACFNWETNIVTCEEVGVSTGLGFSSGATPPTDAVPQTEVVPPTEVEPNPASVPDSSLDATGGTQPEGTN